MTAGGPGSTPVRADIEGLRAVAVIAVVVFHCGFSIFGGGFIGVDVFYVLSGFLITTLMLGEIVATQRLSFIGFYGRRARRLLPAATLVIAVTMVAGWFVLTPLSRRDLVGDALSATTYTINWRFAQRGADYFQSELAPSALQHYWSLALEEQYYIVWPCVIALLAGRTVRRRVLAIGVGTIVAASFVVCQIVTARVQPWAFFGLHTRMWQLGLGALAAIAWTEVDRLPRVVRRYAPAAGLAAIVYASAAFDRTTAWPGTAALVPVLGTLGVLVGSAGAPAHALLTARPMVWIGARSYSWYLWHWPALVLFAAWREKPTPTWVALVICLAALVVGHISFTVIEQPIRRWPTLVRSSRRSLAVGLSLSTLCLGGLLVTRPVADHVDAGGPQAAPVQIPTVTGATSTAAATSPSVSPPSSSVASTTVTTLATTSATVVTTTTPTVTSTTVTAIDTSGLGAILDAASLTGAVPSNLLPPVSEARSILPVVYDMGCHLNYETVEPVICELGDVDGAVTAVLVGDSHAAQWVPALDALATRAGIRLIPMTKSGCPIAEFPVRNHDLNREYHECVTWRDNVIAALRFIRPDIVITTEASVYLPLDVSNEDRPQTIQRGLTSSLLRLRDVAGSVILLGDTPFPNGDPVECLSGHLDDAAACTSPRTVATALNFPDEERAAAATAGVRYVPVVDLACGPTRCPVIVGNLLVYRDPSHLIATYVLWLEPELGRLLGPPWNTG